MLDEFLFFAPGREPDPHAHSAVGWRRWMSAEIARLDQPADLPTDIRRLCRYQMVLITTLQGGGARRAWETRTGIKVMPTKRLQASDRTLRLCPASNAQEADQAIESAQRMFRHTLSCWASDALVLRQSGRHQLTWCGDGGPSRLGLAA